MKQLSQKLGVLLAVILFLSCAPSRAYAEDARCRWADELKSIILSQIKEPGLTIDAEAEALLNQVVDFGARRMEKDRFSDTSIRDARNNAVELGKEIVKQAESAQAPSPASTLRLLQDKARREVKRSHILAALKKLCPLYPFCE